MTTLCLVAAGGLAREVLAVPGLLERYGDAVVLDDDAALWGTELSGVPVLAGGVAAVTTMERARVVVCAGSGAVRRSIVARLLEHGVGATRYDSVVHPSVSVPRGSTVGHGSILLAHVVLTADVRIGRHVAVMPGVTLTHDDVVGEYATLCAGVSLGGHVRVGDAAYVGMNASVRERTTLGAGSTLGMGAVLLEDLPAGRTWAGVPARDIATRDSTRTALREALT